jgi:hypothetical protein
MPIRHSTSATSRTPTNQSTAGSTTAALIPAPVASVPASWATISGAT